MSFLSGKEYEEKIIFLTLLLFLCKEGGVESERRENDG